MEKLHEYRSEYAGTRVPVFKKQKKVTIRTDENPHVSNEPTSRTEVKVQKSLDLFQRLKKEHYEKEERSR